MKGSCLCGAITVSAPDRSEVEVCHCNMCRHWGGGPLLTVHCGPEVTFAGEQEPSTYRSSEWAERGFCAFCGTHLFYHLLPTNEYALPAGLSDIGAEGKMISQIFIDQKADYYQFANETPVMTGEQVFAKFSESGD